MSNLIDLSFYINFNYSLLVAPSFANGRNLFVLLIVKKSKSIFQLKWLHIEEFKHWLCEVPDDDRFMLLYNLR